MICKCTCRGRIHDFTCDVPTFFLGPHFGGLNHCLLVDLGD